MQIAQPERKAGVLSSEAKESTSKAISSNMPSSKESPTPSDPKGIRNEDVAANVSKPTSYEFGGGIVRISKNKVLGKFRFANLPNELKSYVLKDTGLLRDIGSMSGKRKTFLPHDYYTLLFSC